MEIKKWLSFSNSRELENGYRGFECFTAWNRRIGCKKRNFMYNSLMKKSLSTRLLVSMKKAKKQLSGFTPSQRRSVEKSWDIEHAYYSSTLEGSKLDRKEFEKLGEKVL